jgi:hypothetical protein
MGFHKRYITKDLILRSSDLTKLFNADAYDMDTWSGKFYDLYKQGHNKETILKMLDLKVDKELKNI